jgi:hypothetical protein
MRIRFVRKTNNFLQEGYKLLLADQLPYERMQGRGLRQLEESEVEEIATSAKEQAFMAAMELMNLPDEAIKVRCHVSNGSQGGKRR